MVQIWTTSSAITCERQQKLAAAVCHLRGLWWLHFLHFTSRKRNWLRHTEHSLWNAPFSALKNSKSANSKALCLWSSSINTGYSIMDTWAEITFHPSDVPYGRQLLRREQQNEIDFMRLPLLSLASIGELQARHATMFGTVGQFEYFHHAGTPNW